MGHRSCFRAWTNGCSPLKTRYSKASSSGLSTGMQRTFEGCLSGCPKPDQAESVRRCFSAYVDCSVNSRLRWMNWIACTEASA